MQLKRSRVMASPMPQCVRLIGEVAYDDGVAAEEYWYDLPEAVAGQVDAGGNPWLACLSPLAMVLGEPLRLEAPVDAMLLQNVRQAMGIWKAWYPELHIVPIAAPVAEAPAEAAPTRTASFFSGGVDSFFTFLRHRRGAAGAILPYVDDLLTVWGFDVPLSDPAAFQRMQERFRRLAGETGVELMPVATNIRLTRLNAAKWGYHYHGGALSSVALALGRRYAHVLLASSYDPAHLFPWGSHPLTDPLYSTSRTRIIHDGVEFSRLGKTQALAQSPVAMQNLRVCWESKSDQNCGECSKCCRTMLTLSLLDALEGCETFRKKDVDLHRVAGLYSSFSDRAFLDELHVYAVAHNRTAIARALAENFRLNRRADRCLATLRWIGNRKLMWRITRRLEPVVHRFFFGAH